MRRICIVGTGALGSSLLDRLRRHRFAAVLLVDPDSVQERNLALSPLLRRAVAYQANRGTLRPEPDNAAAQDASALLSKAELLAHAARQLDELPWQAAPCAVADVGWQDLQAVDLLCCCTDNMLSRVEIAWIARSLGLPVLDGAVAGLAIHSGRVTTYPAASQAACSLCGLAEDRRASVLGFAASASLGCRAPETVTAMQSTLATLDVVADEMLSQILRWHDATAGESCTTKLTQAPNGEWRRETVEHPRSVTCPWHDDPLGRLVPLCWNQPLATALAGNQREVVFHWPVCIESRCDACGVRRRPMQRVARLRQVPCPACGQARQQPLRVVHRIGAGDEYAGLSPRQLGMPQRHLYWVRETTRELKEQEVAL